MTKENQTDKSLSERLVVVETKQDLMMCLLEKVQANEQRHVWALILMLTGTLVPLVLKVLNIL